MTNLIKINNLLFLMAIVVMVAIMSVACKKKVTQLTDFSVAVEEFGGGENTDKTYDVDVIYPEINDTLISQLDKT